MDKYTLFLDESYTYKSKGLDPAFAIGGFIVKDNDINGIISDVDSIKRSLWGDISDYSSIILHEFDLKQALRNNKKKPEYIRFKNNSKNIDKLYKGISEIIKKSNINTLGCVVIKDNFNKSFPTNIQNDISLVCMQIIIENYTHFLNENNAIGKIVYESRDDFDKNMLMRFYQISSIGTMYVKPQSIQEKIYQFKFISKKDNDACLQIADFIPNLIARKKSNKKIDNYAVNLISNILSKSYNGINNNFDRYGIKVIPRIV